MISSVRWLSAATPSIVTQLRSLVFASYRAVSARWMTSSKARAEVVPNLHPTLVVKLIFCFPAVTMVLVISSRSLVFLLLD